MLQFRPAHGTDFFFLIMAYFFSLPASYPRTDILLGHSLMLFLSCSPSVLSLSSPSPPLSNSLFTFWTLNKYGNEDLEAISEPLNLAIFFTKAINNNFFSICRAFHSLQTAGMARRFLKSIQSREVSRDDSITHSKFSSSCNSQHPTSDRIAKN